jgi:hypothetical protein
MFDGKKEYERSIPHYKEALAIKHAIAGISSDESMSPEDRMNPDVIRAMVIQALDEHGFLRIHKATLSVAVTHQRLAMVYVKVSRLIIFVETDFHILTNKILVHFPVQQQKYGDAFFHFIKALRLREFSQLITIVSHITFSSFLICAHRIRAESTRKRPFLGWQSPLQYGKFVALFIHPF